MALALLAFSGCIWKHSCHMGDTESFLGLLFTAFACEAKKHLFLPSDPGSLKQTLGRYRTRSKQVTFFFLKFFFLFFFYYGWWSDRNRRGVKSHRSRQIASGCGTHHLNCLHMYACVYVYVCEHAWFCCTWSAAIKAYYQSKNIIKVCILNKWFY